MLEIIGICLRSPEFHVGDLKIAPEMTRGVAMRLQIVLRPSLAVYKPRHGIILVQVFGMCGQELDGLRP